MRRPHCSCCSIISVESISGWPSWHPGRYGAASTTWRVLHVSGLIVWRPALTALVTTVESVLTLAALIVTMGVRVMTMSETVLDGDGMAPTFEELTNFTIAGMAAWYGWFRGTTNLKQDAWR